MARRKTTHRRRNRRPLLLTATAVAAALLAGAVGYVTEGAQPQDTAVVADPAVAPTLDPTPPATPQHSQQPTPIAAPPKAEPARGLVYQGLVPAAQGDRCAGVYKVSAAGLCTHGPDAPPKDVDIHRAPTPAVPATAPTPTLTGGQGAPAAADLVKGTPVLDVRNGSTVGGSATPAAAQQGQAVVCDGDGSTGNRVQVLYVHAPGTDRYAQFLPSFKKWAADTDLIYNVSAQETGGERHVRFVTEPDCTVAVLDVEISAGALQEFGSSNDALAAQGFNRRDRKYMAFTDAQVYCGIGTFNGDERPGQDNLSNFGPSYGRTDSGCWNGSTAAHELGHNLGAVNNSAPHSSKAGHCTHEWDLMCYSDAPYYPKMTIECPDKAHDDRLDCGHDDYYNTNPKPGSYLASHWNVANNRFLIAGGGTGPNPNPNPSPSPTPNPTGSPTTSPTGSPTPTPTSSPSPAGGPEVTISQITQDSAVLSWPAAPGAAGYELRVNGKALATLTGTVVRLVQLRPDTEYKVAVAVRDAAGRVSKPGRTTAFRTSPKPGGTTAGKPYLLLNGLTGQAADLWGSSLNDGTVLIGYQRTGYANQQWYFDDAGSGYVRIRSVRSGKCLQTGGEPVPGQWVAQQPCGGGDAQLWKATTGDGGYQLTPKGSDLVLGLSDRWYYGGWLLELQTADQQPYQAWTAQPVG